MSTITNDEVVDIMADSVEEVSEAAKSSHKLLKFLILLGILGIVFVVIKQMTADSDPEPYEPAG